jgi:hypothetical protein
MQTLIQFLTTTCGDDSILAAVATKLDLESKRMVPTQAATEWAAENGMTHFDVRVQRGAWECPSPFALLGTPCFKHLPLFHVPAWDALKHTVARPYSNLTNHLTNQPTSPRSVRMHTRRPL